MGKTADVEKSIWADPWFHGLAPDSKLLYLWAVTTNHGHIGGLFMTGEHVIRFETGLSSARLEKALTGLQGKLVYDFESGWMWVVGMAKRYRSKNVPAAKSIAKTVEECPVPEIQAAFIEKYGSHQWLGEHLPDLALEASSLVVPPYLSEVQGQGHSQGQVEETNDEFADDWLPHYRTITGRSTVRGSESDRKAFHARRAEGRSVEELKLATVGAHSDDFIRSNGHDVPSTILRPTKVDRYIALGAEKTAPKADPFAKQDEHFRLVREAQS